jgi:hypothetical protein
MNFNVPRLYSLVLPEFENDIEFSQLKNYDPAFMESLERTRSIHARYGVGVFESETKGLTASERDFLVNNGLDPSKFYSIKSAGRLEYAHTSRYSIVSNSEILIKFFPSQLKKRDLSSLSKEIRINKLLTEALSSKRVTLNGAEYHISVPQVIDSSEGEYLIYEFINSESSISVPQAIGIYNEYNNLTLDYALLQQFHYSYDTWRENFTEIARKSVNAGIVKLNSEFLLKLLENNKDTFTATIGIVHGDPKPQDHILIKANKIYLTDNERTMITTRYYDAALLSINMHRYGEIMSYAVLAQAYKLENDAFLDLFLLLESFLILREIYVVFTDPNIKSSSISKIGVKKYRDFKILLKKLTYNLSFLYLDVKFVEVEELFKKFDLSYE